MHLEVAGAQWLLPPQRAGFIPAGLDHRVICQAAVSLRTVYLHRSALAVSEPCVFTVTPLAREMLLYAVRWGPDWSPESEPAAASYFTALGLLAREWIAADPALRLPAPRTPDLRKSLRLCTEQSRQRVDGREAARAAGVSPRTLARRFQNETAMSCGRFCVPLEFCGPWSFWPGPALTSPSCAFDVGFDSPSALSKAFRDLTGETPSAYQKTGTGGGVGADESDRHRLLRT